jgi:hypothetical protein
MLGIVIEERRVLRHRRPSPLSWKLPEALWKNLREGLRANAKRQPL